MSRRMKSKNNPDKTQDCPGYDGKNCLYLRTYRHTLMQPWVLTQTAKHIVEKLSGQIM